MGRRKQDTGAAALQSFSADSAPSIAARMAVDALFDTSVDGLEGWLKDHLGTTDEVALAINRWRGDPLGGAPELSNTLAFHLAQDDGALNDLTDILNGKASAIQLEPPARERAAAQDAPQAEEGQAAAAEPVEAFALSSDDPLPRARAPKPVLLAARRLKGDLVGYMLDVPRSEQDADRRPWDQRPEAHQRAVIARMSDRVEEALRSGFMVMLGERPRVIGGTLASVTAKADGVKAVVEVPTSAENLIDLLRGAGERVQIAVADPNAFMGMGDGIPVRLDQGELPVAVEPEAEAEGDAAAESEELVDAVEEV